MDKYLFNSSPISDVSLEIQGPASRDASHFANSLWQFICKGGNGAINTLATSTSWVGGQMGTLCEPSLPIAAVTPKLGTTPVMGIGRLGLGMYKGNIAFGHNEPANQSEIARNYLFAHAKNTIRIAQQNLQGTPILGLNPFEKTNVAGNLYTILASLLLRSGDVYIVTTNYGAKNASGVPYSTYNGKLSQLADTLKNHLKALSPTLTERTSAMYSSTPSRHSFFKRLTLA